MGDWKLIIHGRAGEGAKSAAHLIADAAMHEGKHIHAFPEYGAERGGAPVKAFVKISDKPIRDYSPIMHPQVIIVINDTLMKYVQTENTEDCILIVNTTKSLDKIRSMTEFQGKIYIIDATSIAFENIKANKPNTVLVGSFIKLTRAIKIETVNDMVKAMFLKKLGEEKTNANIKALQEGYDKVSAS